MDQIQLLLDCLTSRSRNNASVIEFGLDCLKFEVIDPGAERQYNQLPNQFVPLLAECQELFDKRLYVLFKGHFGIRNQSKHATWLQGHSTLLVKVYAHCL